MQARNKQAFVDKRGNHAARRALARVDQLRDAAEKTGLSPDILNHVVSAIGGEGSLTHFASMLDKDGDGNPLDDIIGMASCLLGGGKS